VLNELLKWCKGFSMFLCITRKIVFFSFLILNFINSLALHLGFSELLLESLALNFQFFLLLKKSQNFNSLFLVQLWNFFLRVPRLLIQFDISFKNQLNVFMNHGIINLSEFFLSVHDLVFRFFLLFELLFGLL
jgi:hypothetical protein